MDRDDLSPAEITSLLGAKLDETLGRAASVLPPQRTFKQRCAQAGQAFGDAIAELVRSDVDVRLSGVDVCTYGEYVLAAENPTCCHVVRVSPEGGDFLWETSPAVLGLLIGGMLGATTQSRTISRLPWTDIERRLVGKITDHFLRAFANAFGDLVVLHMAVERTETGPRSAQLVRPAREVSLVHYQVSLGGQTDFMHVCLPHEWWTWLLARTVTAETSVPGQQDATAADDGADHVELVAHLAETTIPPQDLANLKVGDILNTQKDVGEPLIITVNGVPHMARDLGRVKDNKAIQIVEPVDTPAEESDAE